MSWTRYLPGWINYRGTLFPETKKDKDFNFDGHIDNHNSGGIHIGHEECMICQNEKRCINLNDHRYGDTDEIDISVCDECIKMGLKFFENGENNEAA